MAFALISTFHALSAGKTRWPFNEPPEDEGVDGFVGFVGLVGVFGFPVLSIALVSVDELHAEAATSIKQSAVIRMANDVAAMVRSAVTGVTTRKRFYAAILITPDEPAHRDNAYGRFRA
jgi:hypothetical protein